MNNTESMFGEWFEQDLSPDKVTAEEFDKYVEEYVSLRKLKDDAEAVVTEYNKKLNAMSGKLMAFLDAMGKTKHIISNGTIQKIETVSWKAPEGEGREEIINYLKEKGEYDSVVAFNAKKFSGWYKAELENNKDFGFKGVEQDATKYLRFTPSKG